MPTIQIYRDEPDHATIVPNIFIDNYMAEANGEFVKIYLYLLRCMSSPEHTCSICTIADHFNQTEKDVIRGLKYWSRVKLIRLDHTPDKKICAIHLLPFPSQMEHNTSGVMPDAPGITVSAITEPIPAIAEPVPGIPPVSAITESVPVMETGAIPSAFSIPKRREYSLDEIKIFRSSEEISEMFFIIETYLKRPLASTDTNTILYWHEELHFSSELIIYLVEYCLSKGRSSFRYMDKVALDWHSQQITSVEQAKTIAITHGKVYYGVMKALGIKDRNLVDSETAFLDKWVKDYGFDMELIQEACKRTITAIHQPSFEYADRILSNWHKNHVQTKTDIQKLDRAHAGKKTIPVTGTSGKNRFNNFDQREYDYDQLEKVLLTTSLH